MVHSSVLFAVVGCVILSGAVHSKLQPRADDFRLLGTVSLLNRILLEANSMSIETYTFVATNESFFSSVIDGVAWRCNELMAPVYNNAVPLYVTRRQLIVVGADDVDTIMAAIVSVFTHHHPNYYTANSRDIYIVLILSDVRYLNAKLILFLFDFFSSINFIVVIPPGQQSQPPVLIGTDYELQLVIVPHHVSMRQMFADRLQPDRYPVVQVRGYGFLAATRLADDGKPPGYDWNVFLTILKHMKLRWKVEVYRMAPTVELMERFNQQLSEGKIQIFIDRNFRADTNSVSYVLPEMNGVCLVIPKTKKYEILHHLLRPLQPMTWIALLIVLAVGSVLASRFFKNSLLAVLIFSANLNAPRVSRGERTVLFASLVVFFILSEAYQAKLLALMSSGRYPPDPKTVDEFLQTDTVLYVGEATATVASYRPGVSKHVRNSTDYTFSYDGEQSYGTLLQCPFAWDMYVRWINQQYDRYGYNVRPQVHIVREKILSLPASYTFSRTFVLYPRVKKYLSLIFESGLIGHWQAEQDRQRQYEQKMEFVENSIISFGDLVMVWTVLGIGNALALVVFLMEVSFIALKQQVWSYASKRRQRTMPRKCCY